MNTNSASLQTPLDGDKERSEGAISTWTRHKFTKYQQSQKDALLMLHMQISPWLTHDRNLVLKPLWHFTTYRRKMPHLRIQLHLVMPVLIAWKPIWQSWSKRHRSKEKKGTERMKKKHDGGNLKKRKKVWCMKQWPSSCKTFVRWHHLSSEEFSCNIMQKQWQTHNYFSRTQ